MGFFDTIRRRAREQRAQRCRELGIPDVGAAYEAASTWALLRNDLHRRCTTAVHEDRIDDARTLARRAIAADHRSQEAQLRAHEGESLTRTIVAARRGTSGEVN